MAPARIIVAFEFIAESIGDEFELMTTWDIERPQLLELCELRWRSVCFFRWVDSETFDPLRTNDRQAGSVPDPEFVLQLFEPLDRLSDAKWLDQFATPLPCGRTSRSRIDLVDFANRFKVDLEALVTSIVRLL